MPVKQDVLPRPCVIEFAHKVDTGVRDGIPSEERERVKALEREVKELRRANEILKLASAFFAQAELGRHLKS